MLFMLKYIDRLLVRGYLKSYVFCLIALLSLYIVVDLFTNLDEFTQDDDGTVQTIARIGSYYGYQVAQIFDRLAEPIALLAAVFTIAWMQHCNELIPLLSAGVSTRRVVMPIILTACFTLGITVINQELIIPRITNQLLAPRSDPEREKEVLVPGAYEPNGIHIEGRVGYRKELLVKEFFLFIPEGIARNQLHLHAEEGRYIPPSDEPRSGGWLLTNTQPPELEAWDRPDMLEMIDPGKYFIKTREVDFEMATRHPKWYTFASTWGLYHELQKPDSTRLSCIAVLFHSRLTRPILGLILVVMGLSVILRDQNRNVFISAGMCLVLCGVFFGAFFTCKSLGDQDYLSPTLAAWLPVLVFGPLAVVMFDAVHT